VIWLDRKVLGLSAAESTERNEKTECPVIDLMEEQKGITEKGGKMRLGAYKCQISDKNTNIYAAYNKTEIKERHRHRYEFNDQYLSRFEEAGMKATGLNPDTNLVEVIEIPSHKWFLGVQFHPEYSSTVLKPHPLFVAFIKASLGK